MADSHHVAPVATHKVAIQKVANVQKAAPVFIQVGLGLREEAIIRSTVADLVSRLEARTITETTSTRSETTIAERQESIEPPATAAAATQAKADRFAGLPSVTATGALVAANCVRCHSGASPNGGLDMSAGLDMQTRLRAAQRVLEGEMPPGGKLADDERAAVMIELLKGSDATF